jgi:teichoic acid transport system permease protein
MKKRCLPGIGNLPKWAGISIFLAGAIVLALIIVLHYNPGADQETERLKKICACTLIALSCAVFSVYYDRVTVVPLELWDNRQLIWQMAVNDFKKRYA